MRMRLLLATIVAVALGAVIFGNTFPDQTYRCLEWTRDWVRILSTRSNYAFLTTKEPRLRFVDYSLAPPFMLRKSAALPRLYTNPDGYEVFEAWLNAVALPQPVLIRQESFELELMDPVERCFTREMRQKLADALVDFAASVTENWRIEFARAKRHELGLVRGHRLARSVVTFSAVGFNRDKTLAVLYAAYSCGRLCGRRTYYLVEKHDGQWKEVTQVAMCGWIS